MSVAPIIIIIAAINPIIGTQDIHTIGNNASIAASHGMKKNIIAAIGGQNNRENIAVKRITAPAINDTAKPAVARGIPGDPHWGQGCVDGKSLSHTGQ